jgi:Protein of unknown function (DUF3047)
LYATPCQLEWLSSAGFRSELKWKFDFDMMIRVPVIFALLFFNACASQQAGSLNGTEPQRQVLLFSAERAIQDEWQEILIRGKTEYRVTASAGRVAIRAIGQGSASGLVRRVQVNPVNCPRFEWSWRVDQLQTTADIRVKEKEDVAASIYLVFGDPGLLLTPKQVPSLRYVWTNQRIDVESIVDSPYLPGTVKSVVVRSGSRQPEWFVESRNILTDFERAFGYAPKEAIEAIALFTDNDQTKEPVLGYYEWGRLKCQPHQES